MLLTLHVVALVISVAGNKPHVVLLVHTRGVMQSSQQLANVATVSRLLAEAMLHGRAQSHDLS